MNNEILEYAKELKKRSESLIKAELENEEFTFRLNDWDKLIHPKMLIQLCNEIERINNLHPVAFITQEEAKRMNDGIASNVYVSKDKSPAFNTPIFIQK